MWKVRHTVLAVIIAGWVLSTMDRLVISVAMPFIGDTFDLSNTQKGLIMSTFFFGYALFQIPWGILVDKYGARKVGTGALAFSSLFTILSGAVTTLPLLLSMRAIFGVSQAAYVGPSWKANTTYWPPARRGTSAAVQLINNALGPAFATTLTALLIATLGWRGVIYFFGAITLIVSFSWWKYVRDDAVSHPSMKEDELKEILEGERESAAQHGTNAKLKDVIKSRTLWKLVMMWFFFDITYWGYTSWIPSYLIKERGFSLVELGFLGALPYYIGAIGIVLSGFYSDHLRKKSVHRKALFIPSALLSGLFIYLTMNATSTAMLVVYMSLTAISIFGGFASIWGIVLDSGTKETMGISSSCVNFGGQVAGFFAPMVMGKLIDMNGGDYTWAFALLVFGAIAATIVAMTLPNNKPIDQTGIKTV